MLFTTSPTELPTMSSVMLPGLALFLLFAPSAVAQHGHGADVPGIETFLVEGLRVDPASPPPGSGVGRAGASLPGGGYLHVVYGKPYKRGRVVFGGLVAYDQIWATGAHQSTELAITVPVMLGSTRIEPGVYSLFTTPGRERWTLHLNRGVGMHLADEYDPALDVATASAEPRSVSEVSEGLVLEFVPEVGGVVLRIRWDRTVVDFSITTPTY
jgi:hypothetical protein